jgi:prepilin-type N-terminal cleavage/methylation domain-containing protein
MTKGVTFIELLLVISIIAIIGAATSPFISRFILQNNHTNTVSRLISSIRKAQNYAMDGKNGEVWGVCLSSGNIRLFSGTCDTPTFSEDFNVPQSVSITGLNEVTFSKLRGEPSSVLNISMNSDIDSVNLVVNSAGGMEIN